MGEPVSSAFQDCPLRQRRQADGRWQVAQPACAWGNWLLDYPSRGFSNGPSPTLKSPNEAAAPPVAGGPLPSSLGSFRLLTNMNKSSFSFS